MKKNFLLMLMIIMLSILAFGAVSVSAATSGIYTYSVSDGKSTITRCNNSASGDIIIPETLGGYPVTSIGNHAFYDCSSLVSITIPDSVTSIGSSAFYWCMSLESITIPDGVTSIGSSAFENCSSLVSITIPDGVTSIGSSAFRSCRSLVSITIPDSVTSIGSSAFSWCDSLVSITIPDSVTNIGDSAFYDCSSLVSITIPDSVTNIGDEAFWGCNSLINIIIDDDNPNYCSLDGVFFDKNKSILICYPAGKIKTKYTIPDSVTSIGDSAFSYCSSLESITIPDGVTSIGDSAFYWCSSLESITIPDGVTSIGDSAFYWCMSLESITIPDSVTSIGDSAFYICNSLINITIPDGVTSIGSSAFENCSSLVSITIPDGVTSIGYHAFYRCSSLVSITIPDSVTSIGNYAFYDCSSLTYVYYNDTADEWKKISIGSNNAPLTKATRKYFWYVTLCNKDEAEISKKKQDFNTLVDTSTVIIPDGCEMVLYTDKEQTTAYDINTPINKNLTLYVDFIKLNKIELEGTTTADIGEKGITQSVSFATDKETKYFSCTLKVPDRLELQEISSDIFEIEQDYEIIGNDTHYYLFLIYNGDGNIPTYKTLNAFEVVFDVSENAVADEMLTIGILDDAILADDDGNSYEFTSIGKSEIKINSILVEEITIIGADEIDTPTQYTVSVLPENTTNSNVEWSVSDETIATISEDGILTPVKKGNVTIKATAKDGSGVYAEKTVSVKALGTVNGITTNVGIWDKEYSPNTTNYTIYVPKSTTSIRITALHDGTLKTDKTTFINNVARTVPLSTTSDKTVLEFTYTCDGCDNKEYTITIIKFEGTKTEVSEDKKSFIITPINIETGKAVILALYNGDVFVEMQSAIYTGEAVPFTTTKDYTNAKVMVWDDITNLKPVCSVEELN